MAEIPTWTCVVAAALQRPDGRWLMHRRPPAKRHGGLWEFPGGKVEPGETPGNALVRELREELGIAVRAADLRPAGFAETAHEGAGPEIVILLYTLAKWHGSPRALEEGAMVNWFTPTEIFGLDRPPLDVALCSAMFSDKLPSTAG